MSNTLFVGHSLVGPVMPTMFNDFMASQSLDIEADAQVINGAPLRYNWDNGASAEGVNARAVLPSGEYDTVIVTEAIPLDEQLRENDTHGYAARYFELAQSANPDTQFYVYETWHEIGADTQAWRDQIETDLPKWQGIADHVNSTAAPDAPQALVIPAGQAMGRLHDRIEAGDVPGVNSIRELFSDNIHLNDTGSWFIAALHASAVGGVDVASLPLETTNIYGVPYGGPDAALAQVMAEVIDSTLSDFLPQNTAPVARMPEPVAPVEETEDPAPAETEDNGGGGGAAQQRVVLDDLLVGTGANDVLWGGDGDDTLQGGGGNDSLYGGDGNDSLTGGAGNDVIIGDGGDDILTLGDGADTVSGGDGNDVFVLTGVPGSVVITDFGANGASDMIDLSALAGYDSFADVAATASFQGANTVLTFAVPNGFLTVTVQSDSPLSSSDFGLPADPAGPAEIVPQPDTAREAAPVEPVAEPVPVVSPEPVAAPEPIAEPEPVAAPEPVEEPTASPATEPVAPAEAPAPEAPATLTYTIEGADSGHFVVNSVSGDIGYMSWFDPSFDRIWDINGDRTYEVERVATDANGNEVSRTFFELETMPNEVIWREVDGPDSDSDPADAVDPVGPIAEGGTFILEGTDAYHFVVNPDSGEIDNVWWFDPSYDQVWDRSGDRIYEAERVALDENGDVISRDVLEMETTTDGIVWRVVSSTQEDQEMSAAEIMDALALVPAKEEDVPQEPEDSEAEAILFF